MNNKELIERINKSANELDFVKTRKYIEHNLKVVETNRNHLNQNARELFRFITDNIRSGHIQPSRSDIATVNRINSYASSFHIGGIKLVLKRNSKLFLNKDIIAYLNEDAKIILGDMGVIPKD